MFICSLSRVATAPNECSSTPTFPRRPSFAGNVAIDGRAWPVRTEIAGGPGVQRRARPSGTAEDAARVREWLDSIVLPPPV